MRRFAWTTFALCGLAVGCGPTGQSVIEPPADMKNQAGEASVEKKAGGRAKSANKADMPSMKPVD